MNEQYLYNDINETVSTETMSLEPDDQKTPDDKMEESQIEVQSGSSTSKNIFRQDLSRFLFGSLREQEDGVFRPLLCQVGELLTQTGEPPGGLRAAYLVLLALISAKLGYPISVQLLCEDVMDATMLFDRCMQLAPEDTFEEIPVVKPEHLFMNSGTHLMGKTVISADPKGYSAVSADLNSFLTRGHATRQLIVPGKYGSKMQKTEADLPMSIVGVLMKGIRCDLNHASILRFPLITKKPADAYPRGLEKGLSHVSVLLEVEEAKLRFLFERLSHRQVEIPFVKHLWEAMSKVGDAHSQVKLEALANVISLCAIMNNPPGLYLDEICSRLWGVSVDNVREYHSHGGRLDAETDVGNHSGPIIATKQDYCMAWWLLSGILKVNENIPLTAVQRRVFEVVKRMNIEDDLFKRQGYVKGDEFTKYVWLLDNLHWVRRDKIFEELLKDGGPYVSRTTLHNVLTSLMKMDLMDRTKYKTSPSYYYRVTRLDSESDLALPHPSEINDPVIQGKPVEIVNPITGLKEKI
jgi:hypothetical protein